MTSYYLMGLTDDENNDAHDAARSRELNKIGSGLLFTFIAEQIGQKIDYDSPEYNVWYESRELYFPYISVKQPGLIAFTKTLDHLIKDRQTMMKLSKYLRFIGIIDNEVIKNVQDEYNIMQKITSEYDMATGDEITEIYLASGGSGSASCMSYKAENFDLYSKEDKKHHHPTEVYDTPDVALAYIKNSEGRTTARTLINVPKKQYSTVYGHNSLALQLEADGYTRGDLDGVKLKLVSVDNGTVCPYIDDSNYVTIESDHLLVSNQEGEYDTHENNLYDYGYLEYDSSLDTCTDCSERADTSYVDGHGQVCQGCLDESYLFAHTNGWNQEWVHGESDVWEHDGDFYTEYGLNEHNLAFDQDGAVRQMSEMVEYDYKWYTIEQLENADLMLDDDGDAVHINDYKPNDELEDDEEDDVSTSVSDDISFIHGEMVIHTARPAVPISVAPDNINEQYQRVIEAHMRAEMDMHRSMLQGYWFDTINTGRRSRRRS